MKFTLAVSIFIVLSIWTKGQTNSLSLSKDSIDHTIHTHNYKINYFKHKFHVRYSDSCITYIFKDSSKVLEINYNGGRVYKNIMHFSPHKKLLLSERYANEKLIYSNFWKYDSLGRVTLSSLVNGRDSTTYKHSFEIINNDSLTVEYVYTNNLLQYTELCYYDKRRKRFKEIHIEANGDTSSVSKFTYDSLGNPDKMYYLSKDKKDQEIYPLNPDYIDKCTKREVLEKDISYIEEMSFIELFLKENKRFILNRSCHETIYQFKAKNKKTIVEFGWASWTWNDVGTVTFKFEN